MTLPLHSRHALYFVTNHQTFTVTPDTEDTNNVSTSAIDNTGRHAYAVSGLTAGNDYEVALVDADTVTNTDGQVSFSAFTVTTESTIELVNGQSNNAAADSGVESQQETVTADSNGEITFTVDSASPDEIIPVVFDDADSDSALDLDADGVPTEDFGIGGQKNWVPAEADGPAAGVTVSDANQAQDYFIGDGETYFYDSNDIFRFQGGADVDMATFEGMLTVDDVINIDAYTGDEADSSIFDVQTDVVPSPTGLEATVSDLDGDGTADDATLTWDASTQGDVSYNVYTDDMGTADQFDDGTDTLVENTSGTSVTINDATGNTYNVGAEGGTSGAVSDTDPEVSPTAPVDADPTTTVNGVRVDSDADGDGNATSGDVWELTFTENVAVASNASLLVGGEVVENGVNADFVVDGSVLTVTLTQDLAGPLAYPQDITDASGITEAGDDNTAWSVGSAGADDDETLDNDGAEPLLSDGAGAGADTDGFSLGTGETVVQVTFNEDLIEVSANNEGNYAFTDASDEGVTLDSAVLQADGRTVEFTFTGALANADTLDIASTLLDTDGDGATAVTLTVQ